MKNIVLFSTLLLFCIFGTACGSGETDMDQTRSESKYTLDDTDTELIVSIPCRRSWTLTGAADWCVPDKTSGENTSQVTFTVEPNTSDENRSCTLQAVSEDRCHIIEIVQYGSETIVLPVVFHVLYNDANDSLQYLDADRLASFVEEANKQYAGGYGGVNLNVEFVLATEAPEGKTLDAPGVEYVPYETAEIDCAAFMYDNSGKYVSLLWNPNQYINIMCYQFAPDPESSGIVMGISHFPYTHTSSYLAGLTTISYAYVSLENLAYPYSVSINSRCTYMEEMSLTLPHELGHYLGLFHVFSEDDDETMCIDSDYCDDTPSYNREDYLRYLTWAANNLSYEEFLSVSVLREGCSGEQFNSVNAMDYNYGAQNQFTAQQRARVRHVLRYSPLLPTQRNSHVQRSSLPEGLLDLPIVTMK